MSIAFFTRCTTYMITVFRAYQFGLGQTVSCKKRKKMPYNQEDADRPKINPPN